MPKRIGKYQLDKTLGSGAFSKVCIEKSGVHDSGGGKGYGVFMYSSSENDIFFLAGLRKREVKKSQPGSLSDV